MHGGLLHKRIFYRVLQTIFHQPTINLLLDTVVLKRLPFGRANRPVCCPEMDYFNVNVCIPICTDVSYLSFISFQVLCFASFRFVSLNTISRRVMVGDAKCTPRAYVYCKCSLHLLKYLQMREIQRREGSSSASSKWRTNELTRPFVTTQIE